MEQYKNNSGKSNVKAYALKLNSITVQFVNGEVSEYSHHHTGKSHVDNMKQLAQGGAGLGTYITVLTKYSYARQLK